jgi:hypothetical protein
MAMIHTHEAVVDKWGHVRLLRPVRLPSARRAIVTILDDAPISGVHECAILSERSLGKDWNRPEEDAAWSYLQRAR